MVREIPASIIRGIRLAVRFIKPWPAAGVRIISPKKLKSNALLRRLKEKDIHVNGIIRSPGPVRCIKLLFAAGVWGMKKRRHHETYLVHAAEAF